MDAVEILAEHTHFCDFCGKGFKRDANLRMHMRGHGDEYKTAAALAKPIGGGAGDGEGKRRRWAAGSRADGEWVGHSGRSFFKRAHFC